MSTPFFLLINRVSPYTLYEFHAMNIFLLILAFLLLLIVVGGFSITIYYAIFYVPYVPTPKKIAKKMVEAANLKKGQKVFDLGAGDGRITIIADQKGFKSTGFELSWLPYLLAKFNIWSQGSKAKIYRKNFIKESLKEVDCVFCYLWPSVMRDLKNKFEEEMKKGSKIVSYCFPMKDWKPVKKIPSKLNNNKTFLIYVYEIGKSNA
jgi:hypothetical protein